VRQRRAGRAPPLIADARFHSPRAYLAIQAGNQRTLPRVVIVYTLTMGIIYDPDKRARTLEQRGLDFEDAPIVFAGLTVELEDTRKDYGEIRMLCYGKLEGRLVVVGYTPRGADRHIFSMRKANRREQDRLAPYFGLGSEAR
jgi:uncharacterized protein